MPPDPRALMRSITPVSTVFLLLATPALAHAGGFGATRFGGEDGHAATNDPTATYFNPAGLAYTEGTQAYIEGFFAQRRVTYNRDPAAIDNPGTGTPTDATNRNSGEATLSNPLAKFGDGYLAIAQNVTCFVARAQIRGEVGGWIHQFAEIDNAFDVCIF